MDTIYFILLQVECFLLQVEHRTVTFKERANFPPAGDASFTCKLPQGCLQEKYWYSTANKKDHVGDEESTCRWILKGWWLEWTGRIFPRKERSAGSHQCSAGRVYSCPKYPNLTCEAGLNDQNEVPQEKVSLGVSQTQRRAQPCPAPSSAQHHLPCLFQGWGSVTDIKPERLQILNLRNPSHVIYRSLMTRIVKREWRNKLQNYLQGEESRAWPFRPKILMGNSTKIAKHQHFSFFVGCWEWTTAQVVKHSKIPTQHTHTCNSCWVLVTWIRKLRQSNPPALTGRFFHHQESFPPHQEISLEMNPRCLSSNPQGFHKGWNTSMSSLVIYWPPSNPAWPSHTHNHSDFNLATCGNPNYQLGLCLQHCSNRQTSGTLENIRIPSLQKK